MGVDATGHHIEGKDGSNEIEVRRSHVCDRCLAVTICAMWENNTLDHNGVDISSFAYLCARCLREILAALVRYAPPNGAP